MHLKLAAGNGGFSRGALPQHILSYSDIRKGVRPALRCRVRANAFKLGGRENLSDGASGDQPDQ